VIRRGALPVALWLSCCAAGAVIVARAHYVADLSAFLPAHPTPAQQLLVDQLREGPASRLILGAISGGDAELRARLSLAMTERLHSDPAFAQVRDGAAAETERDGAFLLEHRYQLSPGVTPQRFTAAGLHAAIGASIDDLSGPAGVLLKSIFARDPTGELQGILEALDAPQPRTENGVWVSHDGAQALLVAVTSAAGSDTDAQERAIAALVGAFQDASRRVGAAAPGASASAGAGGGVSASAGAGGGVSASAGAGAGAGAGVGAAGAGAAGAGAGAAAAPALRLTGPGVFAVAARAAIVKAAVRASLLGSALIVLLLLCVYRSLPAVLLGLLPVASGALAGIAAVALGFGTVHGITLGFGTTLIGESVDYSIYFFLQARLGDDGWRDRVWPTLRLGMLTSVCGFASLLPSAFPGLAQLGLYSVVGLIAAAAVTRFVLPPLSAGATATRDLTALGQTFRRGLSAVRFPVACCSVVTGTAALALLMHRGPIWSRELSALSPVPAADREFDARLRRDLGAADVRDIVVVSGPDLESVLEGAERIAPALERLKREHAFYAYDSPALYLPSAATQAARRASLPDEDSLRRAMTEALTDLPVEAARLGPFLHDVAAARDALPLRPETLGGTSLAAAYAGLVLHRSGIWNALLPLHANLDDSVNLARIRAALESPGAALGSPGAAQVSPGAALASPGAAQVLPGTAQVVVLDLKQESDSLYSAYLGQAIALSALGFLAIVLLLAATLRAPLRVLRVLAPLLMSVTCVAAALVLAGVALTLLHLIGMLLIVAVGSNYALFFDRHAGHMAATTLASLAIANLSTCLGFGVLALSGVPILEALGTSVAPGAFVALLFCSLFAAARHGLA
jgi:predicted exporter